MAELLACLQVMTQTIGSLIAQEISLEYDLCSQLNRLKACMVRMKSTLEDMERRRGRGAAAGTMLHQLRGVVYDANNLLDEFATEIRRRASLRTLRNVRNSLSLVNPKRAIFRHGLASQIQDVEDKLSDIVRDNGLTAATVDCHMGESSSVGAISTIFQGRFTVYGREQETETIVDWLKTEGNTVINPSVLPIQAIGGIGKSTLAREVFHRLSGYFSLKMWVHVSQDFDIKKLMTSMVVEIQRDAVPSQMPMWDIHQLQVHLRTCLSGQRYLLVLDDMWNENFSHWECLKTALMVGAWGSWIIVTTRSKRVAKTVGTVPPFSLGALSHDHCWSILAEYAFEDQHECSDYPELLDIGYEIAKKCNGSPLAAKILGSQLCTKRESREWQYALDCDFSRENTEILQTLKISYDLLPPHLKQCFRFCAIFPKGYQFQRDILILLWMALDFIHSDGPHRKKEDVGREYFDRLLQGSFFQQSANDPNEFTMHDLIHDLSQFVSQDECSIMGHEKANISSEMVRHLSIFCNKNDSEIASPSSPCLQSAYRYKNLYTLMFLTNTKQYFISPSDSLYKSYKYLRALDLRNSNICSIKANISNLKFLRYLNLSNTKIESLPNSLNDLLNLQSLILRNCYKLETLPRHMGSMVSLQHLDLHLDTDFTDTSSRIIQSVDCGGSLSISFPDDIGKLTQLQTLSKFVLKKKNNCGIRQMENLNELQGDLLLVNLQVITEDEEAGSANLHKKECINRLKLQWTNPFPDEGVPEDVLNKLRPSCELKELWIEGYSGICWPNWIDHLHLKKLVHLMLSNCKRCLWIPCLGQLRCLKELQIRGLHSVEKMDCEFCSREQINFPSLRKMAIEDMPALKEWTGENNCKVPFLRELVIKGCPELLRLSHNLPLLKIMVIEGCPKLAHFSNLPSLQILDVKASGEWIWNEWCFFNSLVSIKLNGLPTAVPNSSLNQCTQMTHLEIMHCNNLLCLPEELPSKLKFLSIKSCSQLQTLSGGLGNLSDLEEMEIQDCEQLCLLPREVVNLRSLEVLTISGCPKVSSLPCDGLPFMLQVFSVKNCPLLKQYCSQQWQGVEHIPLVCIDDFHIYSARPHLVRASKDK